MAKGKNKWVFPTLVTGAAIGGGIALLQSWRSKKDPDSVLAQQLISRSLSKTLLQARRDGAWPLGDGRYVIFSDHHKGAGGKADNFKQSKETYMAALDWYLENGYTLIVMGDAEELWEEDVADVMDNNRDVFESEARFYPERYIRLHGNHDDAWKNKARIEQYLSPYFPGIRFLDGLVFDFQDDEENGEIFLAHGHQGTIDSDMFAFVGRLSLPIYREFQNLTGLGATTPAEDVCLRAEHDSQLYRWASKQGKLILIAGHTHRPVWSSRTHLEKLLWELYHLQHMPAHLRPPDYDQQVDDLKSEIKEREGKYPPCRDTIKTRPCYFNTGCCRFKDGDVTGIELDAGRIRLVKWGAGDAGAFDRKELEDTPLREVFFFL